MEDKLRTFILIREYYNEEFPYGFVPIEVENGIDIDMAVKITVADHSLLLLDEKRTESFYSSFKVRWDETDTVWNVEDADGFAICEGIAYYITEMIKIDRETIEKLENNKKCLEIFE